MAACSGLRVLEISDGFCAAAVCGQLFAGLGAQVTKAEQAGGDTLRQQAPLAQDGNSHLFHLLHGAKRIVPVGTGLDIEGYDLVLAGDVALLAQAGLDAAGFSERFPAKVLCLVTTFGARGKRAAWLGSELLAEAMGGLMACTGYPERPAVGSGMPYATHVAAQYAFNGAMAALHARDRTGLGQVVDVSMVDCLITLLGNFIPSYFLNGKEPKRIGNRHTIAAPWNIYPTNDGYVVICTGTGGAGWWEAVTTAIERPDLAHDERYDREDKRVARVEEVDAVISEWTRKRSRKDVVATMNHHEIPVSEIAPVEGVLADPHYTEVRAMVARLQGETGPLTAGLPIKVGAWQPGASDQHAPAAKPAVNAVGSSMAGPLSGIRVLEFGSRTSVPMAGRILADLGADVVKIEPPKGESLRGAGQQVGGSSYLFHINNGGKRSLVVNPAKPEGLKLVHDLVRQADVWIENLTPGALDRMGMGNKQLREINPRLVYCSISGFGHKSNYGDVKAFDAVVQAACGGMFLTGYPDHLPVKIGLSSSDLAAGVALVGAVIAGLRQRERSGAGEHVDLAMADVGVWMTQSAWPEVYFGSGHPQRMGNRSSIHCPHNTFAAKDGEVAIVVESDSQWRNLVAAMGLPADWKDQDVAARRGNVAAIEAQIREWVATRNAGEIAQALQAAGVAAAPLRSIGAIATDTETAERNLIVRIRHPLGGEMQVLGNPLQFSRTPAIVNRPAPVLGEHTEGVIKDWLGEGARAGQQDAAGNTRPVAAA